MTSSNRPNDVVLVGGQGIDANSLALTAVAQQMQYLIVDTIEDGLSFMSTTVYTPTGLTVMRLNAFGSGGDLLIRRDESTVYWRFVGNRSVFEKLSLTGDEYPAPLSLQGNEQALLWGEFDASRNRWYDNRVGKAALTYPGVTGERIEVLAHRVIDNSGRIVAYWTYALQARTQRKEK
jgi:hypothetical protein